MKKSIKYAGVAAATLLAVAPVAAPVLSSSVNTTVQAATTYDTTADAANAFADQYVSTKTIAAGDTAATAAQFGKGVAISDFADDAFYSSLVPYTINDDGAALDALTANKATVDISATTLDGTKISSLYELNNYLQDTTTEGVKVALVFNYTDESGDAQSVTKNVTVTKAAATTPDELKSADVTYTPDYSVAYNSSAADYKLGASADLKVTDQDGNDLTASKNGNDPEVTVTAGNFYDSYNNAYNDIDGKTLSTFDTPSTTVYQVLTATFASGSDFATLLTNHALTPDKYGLTLNGASVNGTSFQTHTSADGKTKSITVIRSFDVSSEEAANWTVKDETGVVTTKTDKTYYTMKNDDNKTITNRALAANTSWKYDQVRTNANGDVQYRVSTHEWVPAESVTVNGSDDNNGGSETPEGALTVTNLDTKGVVSLATPGMTYFVYNKEGVMSTTRALAGGSSWLVDKTATDANGNTYYGVSTDEFVKAGEGVSFTA